MLKWCTIDDCGVDIFLTSYESKESALKEANDKWSGLTEHDKKHRNAFYVGLCNVDEKDNYVTDETGEIDSDVYEIAKEYK